MAKAQTKKNVAKKTATKKASAKKAKTRAQSKAIGAKKKTPKPPSKKPVEKAVKKPAAKRASPKKTTAKPATKKKAPAKKSAKSASAAPEKKTAAKPAAKKTAPKKAARKPTPKETKAKKKVTSPPADKKKRDAGGVNSVDLPPQEPDFSKDEEFNLKEKIKELVHLAQDQGHLTISDVNEALPKDLVTPEKLDEVFAKLKSLDWRSSNNWTRHPAKSRLSRRARPKKAGWTFSTTRFACTSSRWVRCLC